MLMLIKENDVVLCNGKYRLVKEIKNLVGNQGLITEWVYFEDLEKGVFCDGTKMEDVRKLTTDDIIELFNNKELFYSLSDPVSARVCEIISEL